MAAPALPDQGDLLTIDQLSERTGITVRNIRYYAGRGLLPSPQLRGRTGLYGPDHLARLELVSELSALGFTLSAIESHLERVLLTPWVPEEIEDVDRAELDRRAGRSLTTDDVDALERLGAVSPLSEGRVQLHGSGALSSALAVIDSGLPSDVWRRAHELIQQHTAALADDLMAMFQDEVLQPYRDRGRRADERVRLARAMSQLKPVTVHGVVTAFGRAVNRAIRERMG
jgi:DNA-binding transcriptional MerR regulator